jgi:peptidoglycan/LPS O-acetylase OafA/YrhL
VDAAAQARRLGFLDAARGVAALAVVAAHGAGAYFPAYLPWARVNLELGRAGVVLFLLISGFIIPTSLEQGGSLGKFWLRRLFRLFPAYWLCVGLCYASLLAAPLELPGATCPPAAWLANLTMCQGFVGQRDVCGVFWTLQLELVIYAACSVLFALGLLRRVGGGAALAVVLVLLAIALGRPLLAGKPFIVGGQRLLYLLPLMGFVAQRYHSGRLGWKRFYALVVAQPAVLTSGWLLSKILYPADVEFVSLRTLLLNWGVAYALFLFFLEARHLRMPEFALWLGRVSYSVYLLHPLVLVWLTYLAVPAWLALPLLLAGTLAASALSYYAVEEPGIRLGRALERRLFAATARPAKAPAKAA